MRQTDRRAEKAGRRENFQLADNVIDDVLTYALFRQIGLKFLWKNREQSGLRSSRFVGAMTSPRRKKVSGPETVQPYEVNR